MSNFRIKSGIYKWSIMFNNFIITFYWFFFLLKKKKGDILRNQNRD